MPRPNLPKKQIKFALEWLKDQNGQRAYRAAYKTCKSNGAAAVGASRLLRDPKVKAFIELQETKFAAKIARKHNITQENILKEESCLVYSDLRNLFENGTLIKPDELPEEIAKAISSFKVRINKKTNETIYEYRFWDKGRALERMEKYLGMFDKDNQQSRPPLEDVISALATVSPEVAEAVKRRLKDAVSN